MSPHPIMEQALAPFKPFKSRKVKSWEQRQKLAAEIEMLHSLCASAQCWLDAAGYLATNYETKCALQRNADAFRQAYGKITS